jgi:hypothetical protein
MTKKKPYYCVVSWNKRTRRADGYHMCSTNRNNANRLKHRMNERGVLGIKVIERKTKPSGVESVRDAMARWKLKPGERMKKSAWK